MVQTVVYYLSGFKSLSAVFLSILKKVFFALYLCLVGVGLWFSLGCLQLFYSPILSPHSAPIAIKVYPGSNIENLTETFEKKSWITHPQIFLYVARKLGYSRRLQYGEYWVKNKMSIMGLLKNIISGKARVRHGIVFIEGWTFQDVQQALEKDEDLKHLSAGKNPTEIMNLLGYPGKKAEGLFFPAKYYFMWGDSDLDVLKKSCKQMHRLIEAEWKARAPGLPYQSWYQALIVASLVEKEASLSQERQLIAGVILRRLDKKMRLQIDPTTLYGVHKSYGSVITKKDLKADNPYNTYRIFGLPPTPIAMPGLVSIHAALHPDVSEYLYYVSRNDGSHHFSKDYVEHLNAVKKYLGKEKVQSMEEPADDTSSLLSQFIQPLPLCLWSKKAISVLSKTFIPGHLLAEKRVSNE